MLKASSLAILLPAALCVTSCNPIADDNRSASVLRITGFNQEGSERSGFFSDVVGEGLGVADDFAFVEMSLEQKDPEAALSPLYAVTIFAYQVVYTRPDGQNEPGVDVPFPFTLAITGSIAPGATSEMEIILVKKEAKLEAPLRNLWFGDNERIFGTVNVTVFGKDQVENAVAASASSVIVFEDL